MSQNMIYAIEMSQLFADQFRILPRDQAALVQSKIALLQDDPRPVGKNKTRLAGMNVPPRFRIRAGNYRVIYSFTPDTIWLWNVDKRSDVYVRHIAARYVPVAESTIADNHFVELRDDTSATGASWAHYQQGLREWGAGEHPQRRNHKPADHRSDLHPATRLPSRITTEMLHRIAIPERYHRALISCETDDDLVRAVTEWGIPAEAADRVFSLVVDPDFEYIRHQPRKQLKRVEDLTRFHSGDLLDFMVALDAEQRQVAKSVAENRGPALISGFAGTGKSAVLLEIAIALASADPDRRILFTTFTAGLLANTEELLRRVAPHLLPQFAFRTTSSVAGKLLGPATESGDRELLEEASQQRILREIVRDLVLNWTPARQLANFVPRRISLSGSLIEAGPLAGMSWNYLLQEINQVIIGRGIDQELDYLTEPRDGRRVGLNEGQRSILWEISHRFVRAIREQHATTYPLLVLDASRAVAQSRLKSEYDAVFVDEAQDLSPAAIRMLVELARGGDGLVRDLYLSA
ncbi:MAG TPA: UvrD-helicase domain-containing protein, partial [Thermomicrobiales bacterium]|nr:UvrD-helicase domain-containing protein [Thermomicrobiales bacterium]